MPLFDEPEWSAAPAVWPSHLRDAFVSLSPNEAATDFVLEAPIAPLPQAPGVLQEFRRRIRERGQKVGRRGEAWVINVDGWSG